MENFNLRLLILGIASLFYSACFTQTVFLKDYIRPDGDKDITLAIREALEDVKSRNASELVLPGGTLRINADKAFEKYRFISNNDENLSRIAFQLDGLDSLIIQGNGTKLLFSGFVSPFNIENCNNITIENLSIDYTRTFHSEGIITNSFDGGIDVAFPDDYIVDIYNGLLRFRDKNGGEYPYSNMLEFDSELREPAHYAHDIWLRKGGVQATLNSDGSYRILGEDKKGTKGNVMVFGAAARFNPAFTISDSRGITLKDVNIFHCGGMGVIAQMSRDIELDRINIIPGEGRMVSITADATHFVNCTGYIRMIGCNFRNQKDDATNIHGLYMAIDTITGKDRMLVRWRNSGQYGVNFIKPGMTLEFVDNKDMVTYARRTVKDVNPINKVFTEVTFTQDIPADAMKNHVVAADDDYADVLIKGCRMSGNRARGLLLGSRGKIIIKDNYFHIPGAAILFEGDGNYWYEQSGVRDVTIRNNIFENGNYGYEKWGKACIAVGSGIPDKEKSRYHKNIHIQGNTFRVFDPRILYLYCVDGLEFSADNKIEMTRDYSYELDERRNFVIENSDNIDIKFPK